MTIVIIKIAASILIGFFAGPAAVWVFNHMPAKWLCDYGETPEERERMVGLPGTLSNGNGGFDADSGKAGSGKAGSGKAGSGFDIGKTGSRGDGAAIRRIKENPWRWVFAVGFICLCLRLSLADILDGRIDVQRQTGLDESATAQTLRQLLDSSTGASVQLAIAGFIACWILLIIALADLKYMIIPDQFVLLLALSSVGFMPYFKHLTKGAFGEPLIGFAIGAGFMLFCALAGRLIFRQQAFGFGDVKLCGAMGLVLGINGIIAALAAGILISGFVAAAGLATKKYKPKEQKPLGPYLCGGAMAYIFIVMPMM